MTQDELKKVVGEKSVDWIENHMVVGLGTGSTVKYMVDALGKRINDENLDIVGVTTSDRTAKQASELGIPLKSVDEVDHIDLTIDGADEISNDFQGIKGGGAALLFEKIVASNSDKVIWIVDQSKMVDKLGKFPLPVEVIPYGHKQLLKLFTSKGYNPVLRTDDNNCPVLTDSKNYIIDLHLDQIDNPHQLADELIKTVGVVEQGLFLDMVNTVIVGREGKVEVLNAR